MTIGELAKQAGVNPQTIRYYEREGVLPLPARRDGSNYRDYPERALVELRFILRAKAAGFKLSQIQELLGTKPRSGAACGDILAIVRARQAEVGEKLRILRGFQRSLKNLERACLDHHPGDVCPTLDALHRNPAD
jgi:MerR family copper efflux transcriptional regulator